MSHLFPKSYVNIYIHLKVTQKFKNSNNLKIQILKSQKNLLSVSVCKVQNELHVFLFQEK